MEHAYAVIMAGRVGSRFWPASRAGSPKQLLDLTGQGLTMIAATLDRLRPDIPPERVIVVTGRITADAVARALPEVPRENILAEPKGRNTASCIGWAALHVKRKDPRGVMAVMPSDHLVGDKKAFAQAVRTAVEAARGAPGHLRGPAPSPGDRIRLHRDEARRRQSPGGGALRGETRPRDREKVASKRERT